MLDITYSFREQRNNYCIQVNEYLIISISTLLFHKSPISEQMNDCICYESMLFFFLSLLLCFCDTFIQSIIKADVILFGYATLCQTGKCSKRVHLYRGDLFIWFKKHRCEHLCMCEFNVPVRVPYIMFTTLSNSRARRP